MSTHRESPAERLRILWLKTGPLHPLDTGGKIRTYNMLKALKAAHHVTYLALRPDGIEAALLAGAKEYSDEQIWIEWHETPKLTPRFFAELAKNFFASRQPYVIEKYASRAMVQKISEMDASGGLDLILCDFLTPAVNLPGNLRTASVLFQHNVEALIWKRLFEQARNPVKRAYFRNQWRRMADFERAACRRFDGVIAVSAEDAELMRSDYGLGNALGFVPTGVDVARFESVVRTPKPDTIAFLGSMDWMPNIDAVNYFVQEIWPLVKSSIPGVTFSIVGRNPPRSVRDWAQNDPAIRVTGTVPDVRPFLAEAEIIVVPLRAGGGTRIKIFEALAAGVPVVSTSIGMEGLPLTNRENILIADSPGEFAGAVNELLRTEELRRRLSRNGREMVRARYSWEAATDELIALSKKVVQEKALLRTQNRPV